MSTAVKVKKPFLPQRKPTGPVGGSVAVSAQGAPRMNVAANALTIGGEPRVHLLPVDVVTRKQSKLIKRRVAVGIVGALLLVGVAYGLASLSLASAQTALTAAQTQTSQLLVQEGKFGQVNKVKADIAAIKAGRKTGTAQEIDWRDFTIALQKTLPSGAVITDMNGKVDAPFTVANTEAVPLVGAHMATVQTTLIMNQNTIPGWLLKLPEITGYSSVSVDSVKLNSTGSQYTVVATIYLNTDALSHRYNKAPKTGTTGATGTTGTTGTTGGTN